MRLRIRRNRSTKRRELVFKPKRAMTLNMAQVRWIGEMRDGPLLSLCYEASRKTAARALAYDVDGYVSLRSFVRARAIDAGTLLGLAEDLERVVSLCLAAGHPYRSLLFDERYVFVGEGAGLHFAFLPLSGLSLGSANSPLSILGRLGDAKRLRLDSPNAVELSEHLAEFVLGEQGIFSPNDLRDFLHTARGLEHADDAAVGVFAHARQGPGEGMRMRRARLPNANFVLRPLRHDLAWPLATNRNETVGRGRECTVSLAGMPRISRRHASVCVGEHAIALTDLGSTNGTYADGRRLEPSKRCEIEPGQTFLLADEPFCVDRK